MPAVEARRLDLYNALSEFIGPERADTLMAHLPTREGSELATQADIEGVGGRIDHLANRFDHLETRFDRFETRFDRFETRFDDRFDSVNQRLDRLFLTLAAGLIAMIATVFTQAIL